VTSLNHGLFPTKTPRHHILLTIPTQSTYPLQYSSNMSFLTLHIDFCLSKALEFLASFSSYLPCLLKNKSGESHTCIKRYIRMETSSGISQTKLRLFHNFSSSLLKFKSKLRHNSPILREIMHSMNSSPCQICKCPTVLMEL